jgi:hypothetical protein
LFPFPLFLFPLCLTSERSWRNRRTFSLLSVK